MNWLKQRAADVVGTAEPIYGPSALRSIATQSPAYTESTKDDLRWTGMKTTCVETQTFYFHADNGHIGMAQIIYSNVAGIHTTTQFNSKIFYPGASRPPFWCSDPLENYAFSDDHLHFAADKLSVALSEEGDSYMIKSETSSKNTVSIKIRRTAPGFQAGKDGTSYFGTDPEKPWGSIRHRFWPRCVVEGSMKTSDGEIDFTGRGFFVHALQGMKPHHAGARWNFIDFQSPTISAVMMEYTTPPSYGSSTVTVGGVARDGELLCAGHMDPVKHTEVKGDEEANWPEPAAIEAVWTSGDNSVEMNTRLDPRLDRVDVMAEVPKIVKRIVGGVSGARPYIYKFSPQSKVTLLIKEGQQQFSEEGILYAEATFIS